MRFPHATVRRAVPRAHPSLPVSNSLSKSPPRWNCAVGRALRLFLLAFTVISLWCITYDRWGSSFSIPVQYNYVDVDFHLAMIKIAQEGDWPLVGAVNSASLGAPFVGNQNDFPINNRTYWLAGHLARIVGLFPAVNMMMIAFHLLAAFSFYLAARLWRVPRSYAWFFSILYSTLPQFDISLNYFGVLSFGLLPLQLYSLWYISISQRIFWRSLRFRLSLLVGLASGLLNVYWLFLFIQLYLLALGFRFFRKMPDFYKATLPITLTLLVSIFSSFGHIVYNYQYGKNPHAVLRGYYAIEDMALRPLTLFIPKRGQALDLGRSINDKYYGRNVPHAEWAFAYIGVFSTLGLIFLVTSSFLRQIKGKSYPLPFLAILWIIAYYSLGGINGIVSLILDFYKIRGTARYAIAIGTIGLLYLAFVSPKLLREWRPAYRMLLLASIFLVGLEDHTIRPFFSSRRNFSKQRLALIISDEQDLVRKIEASLPLGSMLFMLPIDPFPEGVPGSYSLLRPFFYSTHLRYSFGSNKGRQGADWQLELRGLPAGEMATALESYGFAGILLNRTLYEDRGEQLLSELAEAGWPMEFEQGIDNEWVFIRLKPAENPILPTLTPYAVTTAK